MKMRECIPDVAFRIEPDETVRAFLIRFEHAVYMKCCAIKNYSMSELLKENPMCPMSPHPSATQVEADLVKNHDSQFITTVLEMLKELTGVDKNVKEFYWIADSIFVFHRLFNNCHDGRVDRERLYRPSTSSTVV